MNGNAIQVLELKNGVLNDVTENKVENPFADGKFHFDLDYRDIDNDGVKELYNNRLSDHKANLDDNGQYVEWEYSAGVFVRHH